MSLHSLRLLQTPKVLLNDVYVIHLLGFFFFFFFSFFFLGGGLFGGTGGCDFGFGTSGFFGATIFLGTSFLFSGITLMIFFFFRNFFVTILMSFFLGSCLFLMTLGVYEMFDSIDALLLRDGLQRLLFLLSMLTLLIFDASLLLCFRDEGRLLE